MQSDDRFCAFDVNGRYSFSFSEAVPHGTVLPFGIIPPHGASGCAHVGFSIPKESLPAWRERILRLNIAVESSFTWPRGGTSIYFPHPDGHLLELLTPGVWPIY